MPALMIDSDNLEVVTNAKFAGMRVATYADLVTPQLISATAGRLVVIDRGLGDPHQLATVADIEPRALTIGSAVGLFRQWASQKRPWLTAYHDRDSEQGIDEALTGMGIWHWVATLDGTLLPGGVERTAVQFAGETALGFHADMSIIWDDAWMAPPASVPASRVAAVVKLADALTPGFSDLLSEVKQLLYGVQAAGIPVCRLWSAGFQACQAIGGCPLHHVRR